MPPTAEPPPDTAEELNGKLIALLTKLRVPVGFGMASTSDLKTLSRLVHQLSIHGPERLLELNFSIVSEITSRFLIRMQLLVDREISAHEKAHVDYQFHMPPKIIDLLPIINNLIQLHLRTTGSYARFQHALIRAREAKKPHGRKERPSPVDQDPQTHATGSQTARTVGVHSTKTLHRTNRELRPAMA